MKNLKSFFLVAVLLIFANAVSAQSRVTGRVVEIVDGKTVVIELLNGGLLTAELQYIEVPEPGQPFREVAKEHLQNLTLGKKVEFKARGLMPTKTVGQLFLSGIDVSQQMIRDGAAWYAVLEKNGQNANDSEIYQSNEASAKSEKLGIWSIENLKPSWQVRAEAEDKRRDDERSAQQAAAQTPIQSVAKPSKPKVRPQMNTESAAWSQTSDDYKITSKYCSNISELLVCYNPENKMGVIATKLLKLAAADKDNIQAIGIGVGYFYRDDEQKGRETMYLVGIESDSKDFKFLKSNDLIVTADNQKIVVGKAKRNALQNANSVKERLVYEVKRSVIDKIANAKSINIKAGTYSTNLNYDIQMMLKNLLNVSEDSSPRKSVARKR